ncbi:MAG: EAL domain-containing protein [Pseudomonadota bacterium]|nr:EAL domain-containing protein [Pseudomonadota bacterium]
MSECRNLGSQTEIARIAALDGYGICGSGAEPDLDKIASLAARALRTHYAAISFIDADTQWLKARTGLTIKALKREDGFCQHVLTRTEALVVPDLAKDNRFSHLSIVRDHPRFRFYAGVPLTTADGHAIGSLCVLDPAPRGPLSIAEQTTLKSLAMMVMEYLDQRLKTSRIHGITQFAEATSLGMIAIDGAGRIEFVNRATCALLGYSAAEMHNQPVEIIVPERYRGGHKAMLGKVLASGDSKLDGKTVEVLAQRSDGSEVPVELTLSLWHDERGTGVGAFLRDITERRERDEKLMLLAHHDTLTGLANRRHLLDRISETIASQGRASVILIDLDNFKEVNDSLGHGVGDMLLEAVAIRLTASVPEDFLAARLGGDEFAIFIPDCGDPLIVDSTAAEILSAFQRPFEIADQLFHIGLSIGAALFPTHGRDAEELLASADFALLRAKQEGRGTIRLFCPQMRSASVRRRGMQDELLQALKKRELVLHYQPQIELSSGRIIGAEALLRWNHPVSGLIGPGAFLSALETSSLTLPVGAFVLDEACRQIAEWDQIGLPPFKVGVNLFAAQVRSGTLATSVLETLDRHQVSPTRLELEITETIALHQDDVGLRSFHSLREAGVTFAFDDFGTGYASLSTVRRFPIDTLKIDMSFVRDIAHDAANAAITRAMIAMGRDLGLVTIAEGIETGEQEAILMRLGCRVGQGYRYGRPVPAEAITRLLDPAVQRAATSARTG